LLWAQWWIFRSHKRQEISWRFASHKKASKIQVVVFWVVTPWR
jgi:hypothetical protein